MKHYDKIWIPVDRMPKYWEETAEGFVHKGNTVFMEKKESVIVLTVEELREMWNAGCRRGWEETRPTDEEEASDFETYLQSKGVTI